MGKQRVRHIFISYSRDDKAWAYEFAKALSDRLGYSVFVDYKGIHIGVNWWRTICEHIETCDYVLFIMSPMSIESIYCTAEINYALELNKPILPIMLKSCPFPVKLSQKQVQYLPLNDYLQIEQILIELQKGLSDIRDLIYEGEYQPPDPRPNRPDEPKPKDKKSAEEVFHISIDMLNNADFDQAILLFNDVITADKTGKWGKLAQKRLKETESYQEIARLLTKSPRDARDLWAEHTDEFGTEFDPLGLVEQLAKPKSQTPPNNPPQTPVRTTFLSSTPEPVIETPPPPKIFTPPIPSFLPQPFEWCKIDAGKVTLVPNDTDKKNSYLKQNATLTVPDFYMAKYPVTNAQYQAFVDAPDGYKNPEWWAYSEGAKAWRKANPKPKDTAFAGDDHPRTNITWYESVAFTIWLSQKLNLNIHLPTDEQWQRAAIGDTQNVYPWGRRLGDTYANYNRNIGQTTPVTAYPKNVSPFGVMDMSGNVWEWCFTSYDKGNIPLKDATDDRTYVLRGGSWGNVSTNDLRADVRFWYFPYGRSDFRGVRLACSY